MKPSWLGFDANVRDDMHAYRGAIALLVVGCLGAAVLFISSAQNQPPIAPNPQGIAPALGPAEASSDQDAADRLLRVIRDRLRLMPDVARWKWNAGSPISDPSREESLAAQLLRQAEEEGLPRELASRIIAAQMAASRRLQSDLFARWRSQSVGKFDDVPDLNRELRPQIDRCSKRLLTALAESSSRLQDAEFKKLLARRADDLLKGEGIDAQIRSAALNW